MDRNIITIIPLEDYPAVNRWMTFICANEVGPLFGAYHGGRVVTVFIRAFDLMNLRGEAISL